MIMDFTVIMDFGRRLVAPPKSMITVKSMITAGWWGQLVDGVDVGVLVVDEPGA